MVSQNIILEIYNKQGFHAIEPFISKLPPKILAQIVRQIPESEPYLRVNEQNTKAVKKANDYGGGGQFSWAPNLMSTAIQNQNSKSNIKDKSPNQNKQKKKVVFKDQDNQKNPEQKPTPKCQFCGLTDAMFLDSEKMDLHYLNFCLMLTNCAGCGQIIEIS